MNTLPVDILRLLPQHWDLATLLQAIQVCKLFQRAYALPRKIWVFLELWDYPAESSTMMTVYIGDSDFRGPVNLSPHLYLSQLWTEDYHCKWVYAAIEDIKSKNWSDLHSPDHCYCQQQYTLPHLGFYFKPSVSYQLGSLNKPFEPPSLNTQEIDAHFARSLISHLGEKDDTRVYLALDKEFKCLFLHYDRDYDYAFSTGEACYYLYLHEGMVIWEKEVLNWMDGLSDGKLVLEEVARVLKRITGERPIK